MAVRGESIRNVIERSSLGAPDVKRLRGRTPPEVSSRILREARARDSGDDATRRLQKTATSKEANMANNNRRHVVPGEDGNWKIVRPGGDRASGTAPTQGAAEKRAKEIVRNAGGGEVVIHRPDGTIRDSDTVAPGNDPFPPRDAKH